MRGSEAILLTNGLGHIRTIPAILTMLLNKHILHVWYPNCSLFVKLMVRVPRKKLGIYKTQIPFGNQTCQAKTHHVLYIPIVFPLNPPCMRDFQWPRLIKQPVIAKAGWGQSRHKERRPPAQIQDPYSKSSTTGCFCNGNHWFWGPPISTGWWF